jgi:hypothetical protein
MGIPESQLETWSHQGSVTQSKDTYATVKLALESSSASYANESFSIFLQGSYGNDTNIYAESDVDIVMRLDSVFYYDISALSAEDQARFHQNLSPGTSSYFTFKSQVIGQLETRFGKSHIDATKKAVKVTGEGNRRDADVLVCAGFRKYRRYTGSSTDYDEGICFWNSAGTQIANYPRQHSQNCTTKHQGTSSRFKPMVRILKNMRSRLVSDGAIERGTAPSYYVEGLIYNIPANKFAYRYDDTFVAAMNWLTETDRAQLVCAHEQYYLLRDGYETSWAIANGNTFINEAIKLWNNW